MKKDVEIKVEVDKKIHDFLISRAEQLGITVEEYVRYLMIKEVDCRL